MLQSSWGGVLQILLLSSWSGRQLNRMLQRLRYHCLRLPSQVNVELFKEALSVNSLQLLFRW